MARLRRQQYRNALVELFTLLLIIFGVTLIFLWMLVIDHQAIILYFTYILGYSGILLFQVSKSGSIILALLLIIVVQSTFYKEHTGACAYCVHLLSYWVRGGLCVACGPCYCSFLL